MFEEEYRLRNCSKYPDHSQYYQVSKFKITDLPDKFRDYEIYNLTMIIASLTVRLKIKNDRISTTGSGFIHSVDTTPHRNLCSCNVCAKSSRPQHVYWKVLIRTADHLLEDKQNVKTMQADLFYDDSSSKDEFCQLNGFGVKERIAEYDLCLLEFVSHDEDLIQQLHKNLINFKQQNEKICQRYKRSTEPLVIIVSHPHGGCKRISLGSMVRNEKIKNRSKLKLTESVKEAQLTNVEVQVRYPDGEVSLKNIWQLDSIVKETKEWLLHEGGFKADVKCWQLYYCDSFDNCKIMDDNAIDNA
ncbi:hypothetical protein Btru_015749 [Bulinus truncatus]|nr:hypothetical protein Btru_015749 [Bulinus truncatus]